MPLTVGKLYWHDHGYSPATSVATRSSHGARTSSLRINLKTSLVEPPLVRSGRATNSSSESHAAVAARLRVLCAVLAPGSFNLVCQCQRGALAADICQGAISYVIYFSRASVPSSMWQRKLEDREKSASWKTVKS